ncbi:hypothetical protein COW98_01940 [Candidatus Roizmanbacteria bacterium CG22_combo_CG10-13_8_21_14_all_35_9]|uniref:Ribulose-phosphate 3-epimerase n=5 Tax=Patescibacteria group TaxID=1783273 RepID=A0A1J4T5V6_9BACT|nr:hypothetical protein [Candidatus Falkowbacteria bacterium]OIO07170.1 MAG: hypothetical protein AUJ27_02930 [Candidatus Falkowbacteria bacterium CG1_02_37_44]PIP15040.1 MAG: hypothetical protein COX47_01855 [Candidatus Roizmanbacteria bacterium CG23_combo_of_CG06-09_8_20_14_all_35_49]PIP62821.1 MAG: hypothetical protein COW98_01940 [Candidatus Roizmanbacteria bacterium CG22_combo_CG10-13_8_21_14_all_35_9]PIY71021.1 MAG: hypothetical protein COY88_02540 [Candidatus Roizmanbacteria bacterium CG
MQTVPSILEKDCSQLFYQINRLSPYFQRFQVDIADGIYVDNKTASLDNFIKYLKGSVKTDPYFTNFITLQTLKTLIFDFHLMVKDYEAEIGKLKKLKNFMKIKNIFIHFSAIVNCKLKIENYSLFPIGLVLNPQDQVTDLASKYDLKQIPFLQIMSVVPGAQGTPFLPETLNKVEQLRNLGYRKEIFLDGAVNEKTLSYIDSLKFKPNFICPGSYLTKCPDKELKNRINYLLEFI